MIISIEAAQMHADFCSGENAPNLSDVNADNWLQVRNRFLANVCHNGARSHESIILVLQWLSQFNDEPLINI